MSRPRCTGVTRQDRFALNDQRPSERYINSASLPESQSVQRETDRSRSPSHKSMYIEHLNRCNLPQNIWSCIGRIFTLWAFRCFVFCCCCCFSQSAHTLTGLTQSASWFPAFHYGSTPLAMTVDHVCTKNSLCLCLSQWSAAGPHTVGEVKGGRLALKGCRPWAGVQ